MNDNEDSQVMTVRQVAGFLKYSPNTIYRCLNTGKIPGKKIGGQWRVWRPELEEYLRRRQEVEPPGEAGLAEQPQTEGE